MTYNYILLYSSSHMGNGGLNESSFGLKIILTVLKKINKLMFAWSYKPWYLLITDHPVVVFTWLTDFVEPTMPSFSLLKGWCKISVWLGASISEFVF